MKRWAWVVAFALVAFGLALLLLAAAGFSGMPHMGSMGSMNGMMMHQMSMRRMMVLRTLIFFAVVAVFLGLVLAFSFLISLGRRSHLSCSSCHRTVQPEWKNCPYCGSPINRT